MMAHQPLNLAPAYPSPASPGCCIHARATVTTPTRRVSRANLVQQDLVFGCALALQPGTPSAIAGLRDLQHAAHHRRQPNRAVVLNEAEPYRDGTAKMRIPFFKMSRSIRSRSFSRHSCAILAA